MGDTEKRKPSIREHLELLFGLETAMYMFGQSLFMADYAEQLKDQGYAGLTLAQFYSDPVLLHDAEDEWERTKDAYIGLAYQKRDEQMEERENE